MTRKSSIGLFYLGVAVLAAVILAIAFFVRSGLPRPELPPMVATGGGSVQQWFPIQRDLAATNQDGEAVKLSDLRGKVWVVAQFFAVCPHCAERNGAELRELYDLFKDHPDFHIVCITVDPRTDDVPRLADYASSLGAETDDWWFLSAGDEAATHQYLENELKFFGIRERTDPLEVEAHGRFSHDLGFLLVDRDFQVIGKWPLAESRSEKARELDPNLYGVLKKDMHSRIRQELDKTKAPGI
jgi:protein SCO1